MKRLRLLVLAGVIAAALPLGMTAAGAAGVGTTDSVTIDSRADFGLAGVNVDVGLKVRCFGGSGAVDVWLEQFPPETPSAVAMGSGAQPVVCDGKERFVGLTVEGALFDEGRARATATLLAPNGMTTAVKWVIIVA